MTAHIRTGFYQRTQNARIDIEKPTIMRSKTAADSAAIPMKKRR
jgi:hypothetical protein